MCGLWLYFGVFMITNYLSPATLSLLAHIMEAAADGKSLSVREMCARRGVGINAITKHLQLLKAIGFLRTEPSANGVTASAKSTWPCCRFIPAERLAACSVAKTGEEV